MTEKQIEILERQGCWCDDWSRVSISSDADLRKIRNVYFRGDVAIGSNPEIINVPGGIADVRIGDNVRIVNVARICRSSGASFGVGCDVAVLDETGTRPVRIYPGISAQVAALAALDPEFAAAKLFPMIDRLTASLPDSKEIGDGASITDCGPICDVRIWPGVSVEGAARLKNGSIVSNCAIGAAPLATVGHGVDAEDFIIEDAVVKGGCLLRHVYVGQGCVLDKRFTAHDSLFFANCAMENGEACALLAGPYTVSMHKSSLLIGVQTSFMNAGSGTNMSNHTYKLGPVHWGVMERGAKTASNAYVMHGSCIGAYSLVMGDHKTHPDTSAFPFSYLFGDARGVTSVVPGAMLRSYGLRRDGEKWPRRDHRRERGIHLIDRITFPVLNPLTVDRMLGALELISNLLAGSSDDEIMAEGLKVSRRHLTQGAELYKMAIALYLHRLGEAAPTTAGGSPEKVVNENRGSGKWIDLGSQLIPQESLAQLKATGSIAEIEKILDRVAEDYEALQREWIATKPELRLPGIDIEAYAARLESLIEADRQAAILSLRREGRQDSQS